MSEIRIKIKNRCKKVIGILYYPLARISRNTCQFFKVTEFKDPSVFFGHLIYAPNEYILAFTCIINKLDGLANQKTFLYPKHVNILKSSYKCDCFIIISEF